MYKITDQFQLHCHLGKLFKQLFMMLMIIPNSRACKGGKERGEVKGEYGII